MYWFENVYGISEDVKKMKYREGEITINRKIYPTGKFYLSTLEDFGNESGSDEAVMAKQHEPLNIKIINTNIMTLQNDPDNNNATFQISSNANCLEFRKPLQTKSEGITGYVLDRTQGPYAVICTPTSTLYRNYFHEDVNLFSNFENVKLLGGYPQIGSTPPPDYKNYRKYQVGVHEHCQVLLNNGYLRSDIKDQFVNHVFCSGLPFGYTVEKNSSTLDMNKYLLCAQYRLVLLNAIKLGSKRCFLTRVGAGAYGMGKGPSDDAINFNRDLINSGKVEVYLVERS